MPAFACGYRVHFGTPLTRFVASQGNPADSPNSSVRMWPPHPLWHTPQAFCGPTKGAPQQAQISAFACGHRPCWHTPHTFRGPTGGPTA
eukprot:9401219-Pyramimonas_sp.AAC.1